MHSPDSHCLKEYNIIVLKDLMRIRQFGDINLDFIIDIGANIGISTIYCKTLFPGAKVVAIEPDPRNFFCLQKNTSFISDIYLEQKAFGSGKSCKVISRSNRLLDQYTIESDEGDVPGISMQEIFEKYKINFNSKYFIKSDCEGAEKHFIGDQFCEDAIRNANFFFAEIHFSSEKTPEFTTKWEVYNNWIHETFGTSHEIEYFVSSKKGGYGHYLLKNRGKNAEL